MIKEKLKEFCKSDDYAYCWGAGLMTADDQETRDEICKALDEVYDIRTASVHECPELADEVKNGCIILCAIKWNAWQLYIAYYGGDIFDVEYRVVHNNKAESYPIATFKSMEEARKRFEEEKEAVKDKPLVTDDENTARHASISLETYVYDEDKEVKEWYTVEETPWFYED